MPAHLSAAEAPHDLWQCNECGWTYPNHRPSAKHRRNHKKLCGKQVSLPAKEKLGTAASSLALNSSDESSSDEGREHTPRKDSLTEKTALLSPKSVNGAAFERIVHEHISGNESPNRNGSTSCPTLEVGASDAVPAIREDASLLTRSFNYMQLEQTLQAIPKDSSKEPSNQGSSTRSALAVEGKWICRHCGWTYPNAHPSAKHRRKHKKKCGDGAGVGGSSDDASSDEEHHHHQVEISSTLRSAPEVTLAKGHEASDAVEPPLADKSAAAGMKNPTSPDHCGQQESTHEPRLALKDVQNPQELSPFENTIGPSTGEKEANKLSEAYCRNMLVAVPTAVSEHSQVIQLKAPGKTIPCEAPADEETIKSASGEWQLRSMKSLILETSEIPLRFDSIESQICLVSESFSESPGKMESGSQIVVLENNLTNGSTEPFMHIELHNQLSEKVVVGQEKLGQGESSLVPRELDNSVPEAANVDKHSVSLIPDQNLGKFHGTDIREQSKENVSELVNKNEKLEGGISVTSSAPGVANLKSTAYRHSTPPTGVKKTWPESGEKGQSPKPLTSPGSPGGLVRSRVHEFEKLAAVEPGPMHRKMSLSPLKSPIPNISVNNSPQQERQQHGSILSEMTGIDSPQQQGSPKDLQEAISHLRQQNYSKSSERENLNSFVSPELREVMSYLRHRSENGKSPATPAAT